VDDIGEAQKRQDEHDEDCQHDKPLSKGKRICLIMGRQAQGSEGGRYAHWSDTQGQVVLWDLEVVRTHEGLEGTTAVAACMCIAH